MKIKELIKLAWDLKQSIQNNTHEYNDIRNDILKYLRKSTTKAVSINNITAKVVEKNTVIYYEDMLEKTLPRDKFDKVVSKRYNINNIKDFVKLLQAHGITKKQFKKYVDVEMEVDKKKIDKLVDLGEISMEELEGCYLVSTIEYVDLRKGVK